MMKLCASVTAIDNIHENTIPTTPNFLFLNPLPSIAPQNVSPQSSSTMELYTVQKIVGGFHMRVSIKSI